MKTKLIFITCAFLLCGINAEAQLLKKLKKRAEQAAERTILNKTDEVVSKKTEKTIDDATSKKEKSDKKEDEDTSELKASNTALTKNTEAKKAFFKEDIIIKMHENGNLNQTQFFDANEVAVRMEDPKQPKPGFIDSEGYMYVYSEGEYQKTGIVALQSQGLMAPTMMIEAYKLPPEPFMAQFEKQQDLGVTANPFNGIVEFAFIYKPDDFRYDDFNETTQTLRGKTYTKFEYLNEPGYEGSYVLFDDQDRLVEIYTKTSEEAELIDGFGSQGQAGESLMVYDYKPVEVKLPQAREVKTVGEGLMGGVMENIVKGGNTGNTNIDDDDYDSSNNKGSVKSARRSIKNHKVTVNDLPESYDFNWQLETEMTLNTRKKETIMMVFLINESASYQATKMTMVNNKNTGTTTMLFDMDLSTMVMFMDAQGTSFLQMYPIPEVKASKESLDDYNIKKLPAKTIIGYTCEGLEFEDDRYIMKMYHTLDAKIKLTNFLNFGSQKPSDFPDMDSRVLDQFSNGLILEMDIIDKKKSKNNVNIIAKALNQQKTSIKKANYKTMDLFSGARMKKN
jgi:hypothetical protein